MSDAYAASQEAILHALDLAIMREYDRAKQLLEPIDEPVAGRLFLLVCELEQADQSRERALQFTRHEVGNALSIARANLEGMVDGVVDANPKRLDAVLASLRSASDLLDDLRRLPDHGRARAHEVEEFSVRDVIASHIEAIDGLARAKKVHVVLGERDEPGNHRGDKIQVGRMIRKAVIDSVRYAPPGGAVDISFAFEPGELVIAIREAAEGRTGALQRAIKLRLPVTVASA